MTEQELTDILTQRGYRLVDDKRPIYRLDLVVEPIREDAIPTKLCQKIDLINLSAEGLHFKLGHYCELKGQYYTDEQRRNNRRSALRSAN